MEGVNASSNDQSGKMAMMGIVFGLVVACLLFVICGLLLTQSSKTNHTYIDEQPKTDKHHVIKVEVPSPPEPKVNEKKGIDAKQRRLSQGFELIELSDAHSDALSVKVKDVEGVDVVEEGGNTTRGKVANDDDIVDAINNVPKVSLGGEFEVGDDDEMLNEVNTLTGGITEPIKTISCFKIDN